MADTLEEIYKATVTETDFNASGEATIITTDANTRYAIKDVQVKQGSSNNLVADLLVNDVPVANVTSSATGNEIIGTSSTVKLKTTTFPLTYEDVYFGFIANVSPFRIDKNIKAFVNGVEDTGIGNISANGEVPYGTVNENDFYAHYQVHNNIAVRIRANNNSSTQVHVYNSSNTQVFSETTSYAPKAFDQKRYIYWLPSGSNFKRYDTQTNTTSNIAYLGSASTSSYARLCYAGSDWFWGSPQYNGSSVGDRPYIYNAASNTWLDASNGNSANNTYGQSSDPMWAVYDGLTHIHVIRVNNESNWTRYKVDISTGTVSSLTSFGSGNMPVNMWSVQQWMDTFDNKLWYYSNGGYLSYFDPTDDSFNETTLNFSSNSPIGGRGHIFIGRSTPSTSTISGRTYTVAPSATYRITGVKSV